MVKFWVWTSEIIFFSQLPFVVRSLKSWQLITFLIARYILNALLIAWWFTNLPWIIFIIILIFNFKLYSSQIKDFHENPGKSKLNNRLLELIGFFSLVNFTFAIPFWGDPNKAFSRFVHRIINLIGIAAVLYAATIKTLHDAWSCYSPNVFPDATDYNFGMCPQNLTDQNSPICSQPFIHCDDRAPLTNGLLFQEIAITLVTASGVLYIFGCPFF